MESSEIRQSSFRDILHVIFKRKGQLLLFFVVTIFVVAVGTLVTKPMYEAAAQIFFKFGRENLFASPGGGKSTFISFNEQINSEIALLKSRSLVAKVIRSLGTKNIYKDLDYSDAVLKFKKTLRVEGVKRSNIITISFRHEDPEMAALVLNTLAESYLDYHLMVHKNSGSYNFFEEQSRILENKFERSEKILEAFKKQHKVTDLQEQQRLLLTHIADLRSKKNLTLSRQAEIESRIKQLQKQLNKTPETILQGEEVDINPFLISNFQARLIDLELKEKALLSKYTLQSRLKEIKIIKEEIKMVKEKLAELETKRYQKSRTGLNTTYQRLKEELFKDQAEQKAIVGKKQAQSIQLASFQEKLDQLNRIEIELSQLQQTVDVNRQNYRLYLSKLEEARISAAMDNKRIANVSLIEPALPPLKPVSPKVLLNIILAILIGGLGGTGATFFIEYLDDSLENPEDVEEALRVPVLASIPKLALKG